MCSNPARQHRSRFPIILGNQFFRLASMPEVPLSSQESNSPLKEVTWHHIDGVPLVTHYENGDRNAVFNQADNEGKFNLVDLIKKQPRYCSRIIVCYRST